MLNNATGASCSVSGGDCLFEPAVCDCNVSTTMDCSASAAFDELGEPRPRKESFEYLKGTDASACCKESFFGEPVCVNCDNLVTCNVDADIVGDEGKVGTRDLIELLKAFRFEGSDVKADLNRDGVVDPSDKQEMQASLGGIFCQSWVNNPRCWWHGEDAGWCNSQVCHLSCS